MKYHFMNEHRHKYSLLLMCRVLKVARAGFDQWLHKPLADRAIEDQRLVVVSRHHLLPAAVSMALAAYFAICGKQAKPAARTVLSGSCVSLAVMS